MRPEPVDPVGINVSFFCYLPLPYSLPYYGCTLPVSPAQPNLLLLLPPHDGWDG